MSHDYSGLTSLHSSTRIKNRSNRDMMGAVKLMFCWATSVCSVEYHHCQYSNINTGVGINL